MQQGGVVPPHPAPADAQQAKFEQFAPQPQGARPATGAIATEPKPERKGRLIVGVLVGCVALLAVAFGGLFLIYKLAGPTFKVGDCVKQNGNDAVAASCTDEGAYKVVSSVKSADECDQTQPFVKLDDEILCLKPASAP
jgi:hypothetical protein